MKEIGDQCEKIERDQLMKDVRSMPWYSTVRFDSLRWLGYSTVQSVATYTTQSPAQIDSLPAHFHMHKQVDPNQVNGAFSASAGPNEATKLLLPRYRT